MNNFYKNPSVNGVSHVEACFVMKCAIRVSFHNLLYVK